VLSDAELIAVARERAAGSSVIITFANALYADVLMNWLVALSLNSIDNYLVIALDRELHAFLSDRGIATLLCEMKNDLGDLWIQRVRIFATLCDAGVDFVHSDVDAVWLRDPRRSYFTDANVDLVASQGTVWPPDVHQRFGFVLCCGLFRLRSTPVSRQLLTDLEPHVVVSRDDQVSLNRLLAARSIKWHAQPADTYYVALGTKQFLCSRTLMRGVATGGLRAANLDGEPYVCHFLTPKDPQAKMREFARHGHLFVRTDWREQKFDVTSLATLRR
jgi:Nucleotide-diphospho-sugar transferase